MSDNAEKINQLYAKLESLLSRQEHFYREINDLKLEISRLRNPAETSPAAEPTSTPVEEQKTENYPINSPGSICNHSYSPDLSKSLLNLKKALYINLPSASNSNQVLKILSGKT